MPSSAITSAKREQGVDQSEHPVDGTGCGLRGLLLSVGEGEFGCGAGIPAPLVRLGVRHGHAVRAEPVDRAQHGAEAEALPSATGLPQTSRVPVGPGTRWSRR